MLHLSSEVSLRALALGEVIFRRAVSFSDAPLTSQGAHTILNRLGPALRLVARGDESLDLPANVKAPLFGDGDLISATFLVMREARGPAGVLGALEKAITPSLTVSDRSVLVNQVGLELEKVYRKRRVIENVYQKRQKKLGAVP